MKAATKLKREDSNGIVAVAVVFFTLHDLLAAVKQRGYVVVAVAVVVAVVVVVAVAVAVVVAVVVAAVVVVSGVAVVVTNQQQ